MENEWPPLKNCPHRHGIIRQYLQKFDWEDDEADETEYELFYDNSDDEDEAAHKFPFKPSNIKDFLQQVRTTRGYDVDMDARLPQFMGCPFLPVLKEGNLGLSEGSVNHAIHLAIEHINSQTKKFYKHLNTLNVINTRHSILLLTFTAGAAIAAGLTKKMKENPEEWQKKVAAAPVEHEQTFYATVLAPPHNFKMYKFLECFHKPQGPAPWEYEELS